MIVIIIIFVLFSPSFNEGKEIRKKQKTLLELRLEESYRELEEAKEDWACYREFLYFEDQKIIKKDLK